MLVNTLILYSETLAQKHAFQNAEELNILKGFYCRIYVWFIVIWNILSEKNVIPSYALALLQEKQHIGLILIFMKVLPCA